MKLIDKSDLSYLERKSCKSHRLESLEYLVFKVWGRANLFIKFLCSLEGFATRLNFQLEGLPEDSVNILPPIVMHLSVDKLQYYSCIQDTHIFIGQRSGYCIQECSCTTTTSHGS